MTSAPFVGRVEELAQLEKELALGGVVTLMGTAGTGKTRLAVELVRRLGDRAGRNPLVLIDDPGDPARLREWACEVAAHTSVLVTSRDLLGCKGERVVALGPLPLGDCERLAAELLGPGISPEALRAVAELSDGLPGAVERIAEASGATPLATVLDSLRGLLRRAQASGQRLPRSATMALVEQWAAGPLAA